MESVSIQEYFKNDAFAAAIGVELIEAGNGFARSRMKIEPMHLNGGGVCQGGAIFTLADFTFAVAANSHAQLTFSINSDIRFFKSEKNGYLYAEAHEVFNGRRLSNCEVKITNEQGDLVATFNATGYRKDVTLPFEPIENKE